MSNHAPEAFYLPGKLQRLWTGRTFGVHRNAAQNEISASRKDV